MQAHAGASPVRVVGSLFQLSPTRTVGVLSPPPLPLFPWNGLPSSGTTTVVTTGANPGQPRDCHRPRRRSRLLSPRALRDRTNGSNYPNGVPSRTNDPSSQSGGCRWDDMKKPHQLSSLSEGTTYAMPKTAASATRRDTNPPFGTTSADIDESLPRSFFLRNESDSVATILPGEETTLSTDFAPCLSSSRRRHRPSRTPITALHLTSEDELAPATVSGDDHDDPDAEEEEEKNPISTTRRNSIGVTRPVASPSRSMAKRRRTETARTSKSDPTLVAPQLPCTLDPTPASSIATMPTLPPRRRAPPRSDLPLDDLRCLVHLCIPGAPPSQYQHNNDSQERRLAAKAAAEAIQQSTLYPIVPSRAGPSPRPDPSSLSREARMALFRRLSPALQHMNQAKQTEILAAQHITECRVAKRAKKVHHDDDNNHTRASSRGEYRYQHTTTGRSVSATEYELRYEIMLSEIRSIHAPSWAAYFRNLRTRSEHDHAKGTRTARTSPPLHPPSLEMAEHDNDAAENTPVDTADDDSIDMNGYVLSNHALSPMDEQPHKAPHSYESASMCPREENKKDACPSSRNRRPDESAVLFPPAVAPEDRTLRNSSPTGTGRPAVRRPPSAGRHADVHYTVSMPLRDQPASEDSEIAAAERKLWSTMDRALAEYSQDIVAIHERRRRQLPSRSSLPRLDAAAESLLKVRTPTATAAA